jgi:thiamine-monophosphate kinase
MFCRRSIYRFPMPDQNEALGEFGLIDWIRAQSRAGSRTRVGIGDDCAILDSTAGRELLVTTDMLMDGRHFQLERDGPEVVGYKALGVNLSDIAAMAGIPTAAVVAVALPAKRAIDVARGIHAGMRPLAERLGVDLVGGDTNAWDGPLVISVTVLGEPTERGPVLRSGAKAGDALIVTGPLGGSLLGRHLRPQPRVQEAVALLAAAPLHAAIDISDGLAADLTHILEESGGRGAILDADAIPIHPDAESMSRRDGRSALDHALNDGEDFELCLAVARDDLAALARSSTPFAVIGEVTAAPGIRLRRRDGSLQPVQPRGFDHLRANSSGSSPEITES